MIQPQNTAPRQLLLVFFFSLIFGVLLISWAGKEIITANSFPIGVDIYPRWVGSRAFWRGESPYSTAVELETQQYVLGRPALPGEDTLGFYYPAHAAIVLAPLALLPAPLAAILWSALSWAILGLIVFLIVQSIPKRVSVWVLLLVALTVFFQRSALLVVLNGQYALFVLALWGGAYYLIQRQHDVSGGVLLAMTTIKPTLSFLPLLVFMIWAFRNGRHKITLSFLLTLGLLFVISLIQIGWWVPDFLAHLEQYDMFPRQWVAGNISSLPGLVWLGGTMVLLYAGIKTHQQNRSDFPWLLLWGAISLTLLVTPHTAEYDIVIFLLPLLLYAPRFLQTKAGLVVWLLLWWLPWLTWGAFILLGYGTGDWYRLFWWHLPQIWVLALLVFLYANRPLWQLQPIEQGVTE